MSTIEILENCKICHKNSQAKVLNKQKSKEAFELCSQCNQALESLKKPIVDPEVITGQHKKFDFVVFERDGVFKIGISARNHAGFHTIINDSFVTKKEAIQAAQAWLLCPFKMSDGFVNVF